MKGLVFTGDRTLELMSFPDPSPGAGEVVLEIKASGLCGSDLKFYRAPNSGGLVGEGGQVTIDVSPEMLRSLS